MRRYLDRTLVVARVDMQDMPAVAEHFGVGEPPALLFLAPTGSPLVVLRGFHGPDSILRVATYAVSEPRNTPTMQPGCLATRAR